MKRNLSPLDYSAFYRAVAERDDHACQACRAFPEDRWKCVNRSGAILDAHHVIPQRVLRRELPPGKRERALRDPRNGVLLGRWHHGMVEHAMRTLPVPEHVEQFCREYGLEWWLTRREAA